MENQQSILDSANQFLAGRSRPTVNVGFDMYTIGITLFGLLAVAVMAGIIIKKV